MFLLLISGLAGVLYGLASGNLLSVAMPYFEHTMTISATQMSTLVASFSVVAIFSGFAAGPLAEWCGRKKPLIASAVIFIAATPVICCCRGNYWMLLGGLGLQGLSMGLIGTVAPLYLAESLPAEHRGKGTGLFQLFLIGGIALSGLIGLAVSYWLGAGDSAATDVAQKTTAWQTIFWLATAPGILLFLGSLFIPESPEWLKRNGKLTIDNGKIDNGKLTIDNGKLTIENERDEGQVEEKAGFRALFSKRYVVPFLVVFLIVSCNKLCGLPYILCYSVKIFQTTGLAGTFANWADLTFKTVMFGATALACVLVDRKGRKFLLGIGTAGIAVSMAVIAGVFFAIEHQLASAGGATGVVAAIAITLFIGFYSVGPGVCVWLVMTEVLPARIRAIGMSVTLLANHFIASAQQWTFLPMGEKIGFAPVFIFCAVCAAVYFFAVRFGMPETKGMQLGDIEKWYDEKLGRRI